MEMFKKIVFGFSDFQTDMLDRRVANLRLNDSDEKI